MNLAAQWRSGSTWQRRTVIPAVPKCATVFGSDSTERENKQVATLKKKNAAMRIHNCCVVRVAESSMGFFSAGSRRERTRKQNSTTTVLINKTNNLLNLSNHRPDFCTCCTLTQVEIKRLLSSHPHRCFLGALAHGADMVRQCVLDKYPFTTHIEIVIQRKTSSRDTLETLRNMQFSWNM